MKCVVKNYNSAEDIIDIDLIDTIIKSFSNVDIPPKGKAYTNGVRGVMRDLGWSRKIPIHVGSSSKIDGIKNGIGLVVYLGNHFVGYHSLMNLEYMYRTKKIHSGIYITQTLNQAINRHRASIPSAVSTGNFIQFERLTEDIDLYDNFLLIPLSVIGLEKEVE